LKLLLDTHTWLWQLADPRKLSGKARVALRDPEHGLWLSPMSVWEAVMLARRGRIVVGADPLAWVRRALVESPLAMAPVTHDIALGAEDLPGYDGRDPVDRFLAATAIAMDLTLVTVDRSLRRYRKLPTLW
jgi:PIN domain nuclease of toxin-antitoxin system